jgi:GH25 family lysozyme M1 (1,4-beta-N-acetylmuramidase)
VIITLCGFVRVAHRRLPRGRVAAMALVLFLVTGVVFVGTAGAAPTAGTRGVDISSYQHPGGLPINWVAVRSSGIRYAYVKATEGVSYTNPWFRRDWQGAGNAGLYRGAYHYARPRYPLSTAELDAQRFVQLTGSMRGPMDLAPALDLEETGGLSPAALTAWTQRWLVAAELATGRRPIIYSGWAFWKTAYADTSLFAGYELWMARWASRQPGPLPGGWSGWKVWQYGTTFVPGIVGAVDANVLCGYAPAPGNPKGSCPAAPATATTVSSSKAATSKAATSKAATSKAATSKVATSKVATSKAATKGTVGSSHSTGTRSTATATSSKASTGRARSAAYTVR